MGAPDGGGQRIPFGQRVFRRQFQKHLGGQWLPHRPARSRSVQLCQPVRQLRHAIHQRQAETYSKYPDRVIPFIHYNQLTDDLSVTNNYCMIADVSAFHSYVAEWTPAPITITYYGATCLGHKWNPAAPPSIRPRLRCLRQRKSTTCTSGPELGDRPFRPGVGFALRKDRHKRFGVGRTSPVAPRRRGPTRSRGRRLSADLNSASQREATKYRGTSDLATKIPDNFCRTPSRCHGRRTRGRLRLRAQSLHMIRRAVDVYRSLFAGLVDVFIVGQLIDMWLARRPLSVEPPVWNDGTD